MENRFRVLYFALIVLIGSLFIPLISCIGPIDRVSVNDYYTVVSSLIAGVITLIALSWQIGENRRNLIKQFQIDRDKRKEDAINNTRGYFDIKYWHNSQKNISQYEKVKPYISESHKKNEHQHYYLVIRYISTGANIAKNCKLFIDSGKPTYKLGVVFPGQTFAIPIGDGTQVSSFAIEYTTIEEETLNHNLTFKQSNNIKEPFDEYLKSNKTKVPLIDCTSVLYPFI